MAKHHIELRNSPPLNGMGFGAQHLLAWQRPNHFGMHSHDIVEMAYIVTGECAHRIGQTTCRNAPGSLGIIHYSQEHDLITDSGPIEVINVYFDMERFPLPSIGGELQHALHHILPLHPSLRHRQNQFVHLSFDPNGALLSLLRQILDEQQQRRPGWRDAIANLEKLFLIACARHALEHGVQATPSNNPMLERMEALRRRLDDKVAEPIALTDVARELDISPHYLCRAFKKHTSHSLGSYQLRQRINMAMQALRDSDDSVTQVALDCGFNDQSYFNRKFRALVGMTPTAWRKSADTK
jgi:AraC-like DNA-binding protein